MPLGTVYMYQDDCIVTMRVRVMVRVRDFKMAKFPPFKSLNYKMVLRSLYLIFFGTPIYF